MLAPTVIVLGCITVYHPSIDSLEPAGALVGSQGFTLTIREGTFNHGTLVRFGATEKPVTLVNETTLEISVDASEVASPGQIGQPGGGFA